MRIITRLPWFARLLVLAGVLFVAGACAPPQPSDVSVLAGRVTPTWFGSAEMARSLPVHVGIDQGTVDLGGAAWDPGSAAPGENGTVLLFGHRVSHGGPFRTLGALGAGAIVSVEASDGHTYHYAVVRTRVTVPNWSAVLDYAPPSGQGLSLIACHPLGSTSQRLIVDADLAWVD